MNEALSGLWEFGLPALVAGALVSVLCGVLSVQVVLNRIVFVSAALAEVAAMGIALSLWLGHHGAGEHVLGSLALTALAVWLLGTRLARGDLPAETRLGILYAFGGATSILFVAKSPAGKEEVVHLLEGSLLFATWSTCAWLAGVTVVVAGVLVWAFPHLVLIGFDPDGAQAMGYRLWRWRILLFGLVGAAVASATHSVGTLMCFADLVLPAAIALDWTSSLSGATAASALLAVAAHGIGLAVSFHPAWDLPPAPVAISVLTVAWLVSRTLARVRRG